MAKVIWRVEVGGQPHIVEMQIDAILGHIGTGGGQLLIDGKVVDAWGSALFSPVPARTEFEIDGKHGIITRKWSLYSRPVMFFDGKEIKRI